MPTITIRFKLPDEQEEYNIHHKAMDMHAALLEIAEAFRQQRKHGAKAVTEKVFWEIVNENKVELWD